MTQNELDVSSRLATQVGVDSIVCRTRADSRQPATRPSAADVIPVGDLRRIDAKRWQSGLDGR